MIHARSDYNRIQDPAVADPGLLAIGSSAIGEDEPVFLLRAKDQAFATAVSAWIKSHLAAGGDRSMVSAMALHLERVVEWQSRNGCKVADAPADVLSGG